MDISTPVYWEQGLFLQPQHFQLSQLHSQYMADSARAFYGPHPWGIGKLDIDTSAIPGRVFAVNGGVFVFRDGCCATMPGNVVIEKRSFDGQWPESADSMKVYLGIRRWDAGGGNVTEVADVIEPAKISTRYACSLNPGEIPDLHGNGPSASVKRLTAVLRVFWEQEKEKAGEYELLPVALVTRRADAFELARNYIPPCYSHRASNSLTVLLEEIISMIASRCRQMEEIKRRPAYQNAKLGNEDFMEFTGLKVLSEVLPMLRYLFEAPGIHPWDFFGVLHCAAGRLSVFSPELGADGNDYNGERRVPAYDHLDLYGCFSQMRSLLSVLLNQLSLGVENSISLTCTSPSIYSGRLSENMRSPASQFFLVVRSQSDPQKLRNELLTIAKLSSAANIQAIASRFVGGISLQHIAFPPSGVPNLSGALYFAINVASPQWRDLLATGDIALYWEGAPADVNLEIVMQRST